MKEDYLQFIWKTKQFFKKELRLTDGRLLTVKNVGWHNKDSGPDFFNGTIEIDGLSWSGNVEIHIKSSDWYKHKHHLDDAYTNVVLHVVLEHDQEVYIDDKPIPVFCLAEYLDERVFAKLKSFTSKKESRPCANQIKSFNQELHDQVEISFFNRIERKGISLLHIKKDRGLSLDEVLIYAIASALGGRLNKEPMQELFSRLPFKALYRELWSPNRVRAIVFGTAGLLNGIQEDPYEKSLTEEWKVLKRKYTICSMNSQAWKFKGVRPYSFPTRKLAEFGELVIELLQQKKSLVDLSIKDSVELAIGNIGLPDYWQWHFHFGKQSKRKLSLLLSSQSKSSIRVNAIGPYLSFLKHKLGNHLLQDEIQSYYFDLQEEQNYITKQWQEMGVSIENALQSQGLLELNNEFCIFRKCLTCRVGESMLQS